MPSAVSAVTTQFGQRAPLAGVVNTAHQRVVVIVLAAIVVCLVGFSLDRWRRSRDPLMLMLLLGGAVCSLNEPVVDTLGDVWFYRPGQQTAFTWYGHAMPLWGVLAYICYFGAMPFLIYVRAQRGVTRAGFRLTMLMAFLCNLAIEIPILRAHLYVYFGYSPMKIGRLPIYWLVVNAGGPVLTAFALHHLWQRRRGLSALLVLLLPVTADAAFSLGSGWPAFFALSFRAPNPPHAVVWLGCIGSLLLGALLIDQIGRRLSSAPMGRSRARRRFRSADPSPLADRPPMSLESTEVH